MLDQPDFYQRRDIFRRERINQRNDVQVNSRIFSTSSKMSLIDYRGVRFTRHEPVNAIDLSSCSIASIAIAAQSLYCQFEDSTQSTKLINNSRLERLNLTDNLLGVRDHQKPAALSESIKLFNLNTLTELNLSTNFILNIPGTIMYMTSLVSLDLSDNYIKELPTSITSLINLRLLNLDKNQLTTLDRSITNFNALELSVKGNHLFTPPQAAADEGFKRICEVFADHDIHNLNCRNDHEDLKLIIVGNSGVTPHVESQFIEDSSSFYSVGDWIRYVTENYGRSQTQESEFGARLPNFNVWDFSNCESFRGLEKGFFSAHAVYIIVWDASKSSNDDIDTHLQFWIDLIEANALGSTTYIVGTFDKDSQLSLQKLHDIKTHVIERLLEVRKLRKSATSHDLQSVQIAAVPVVRDLLLVPLDDVNSNNFWALQHECQVQQQLRKALSVAILGKRYNPDYSWMRSAIDSRLKSVSFCSKANLLDSARFTSRLSLAEIEEKNFEQRMEDAIAYYASVGEIMWIQKHLGPCGLPADVIVLDPSCLINTIHSILGGKKHFAPSLDSSSPNHPSVVSELKLRKLVDRVTLNTLAAPHPPPRLSIKRMTTGSNLNWKQRHHAAHNGAWRGNAIPSSFDGDGTPLLRIKSLDSMTFQMEHQPLDTSLSCEDILMKILEMYHVIIPFNGSHRPAVLKRSKSSAISALTTAVSPPSHTPSSNQHYLIPSWIRNDSPLTNLHCETFANEVCYESFFAINHFIQCDFLFRVLAHVYNYPFNVSIDYDVWSAGFLLMFSNPGKMYSLKVISEIGSNHKMSFIRVQLRGCYLFRNNMLRWMDVACRQIQMELQRLPGLGKEDTKRHTLCPACLSVVRGLGHPRSSCFSTRSINSSSDDDASWMADKGSHGGDGCKGGGDRLSYDRADKNLAVYRGKKIGVFSDEYGNRLRKELQDCLMSKAKLRIWHYNDCVCKSQECRFGATRASLISIDENQHTMLQEIEAEDSLLQRLQEDIIASAFDFSLQQSTVRVVLIRVRCDEKKELLLKLRPNMTTAHCENTLNMSFSIDDMQIVSGVVTYRKDASKALSASDDDLVSFDDVVVISCDHHNIKADVKPEELKIPVEESLYLIGDGRGFHYCGDAVFLGVRDGHKLQKETHFDLSAVRVIAPIGAIQSGSSIGSFSLTVYTRDHRHSPTALNLNDDSDKNHASDPVFWGLPGQRIARHGFAFGANASSAVLFDDQVACLMGFPRRRFHFEESVTVSWGRVKKFDHSEILFGAFAEAGNSGGPLFDGAGRLLGIISKGYENSSSGDYSVVIPIDGEFLNLLWSLI